MVQKSELEYAGFWIRVGASIIDTTLLLFITIPITMMIYGDSMWENESIIIELADFLVNWVLPAVIIIIFWLYKSATPGKMLLGLKVVNAESGEPLSVGQAIGRYLGYFISTIPLFIGIFWVAWDKKRQGWHDKLAGSVVVRNKNTVEEVNFNKNSE